MKSLFVTMLPCLLTAASMIAQTDDAKIKAAVDALAEGWSNADGERFASSFAEKHDYIVWNGMFLKGMDKATNAATHAQLFRQVYPNTNLWLKIDQIKYLRDDLARVHVYGAVYPKELPPPEDPKVIISMIMEKQGADWKIIDFHNTNIELHPASPTYAAYVADQTEVLKKRVAGLLEAWNERNAEKFASFFQDEVDVAVAAMGTPGLNMSKEALQRSHERLFAQSPEKEHQAIQRIEVDFLDEKTAVCNATFAAADGGPEAELTYLSLIFSKTPYTNEWLIRSFNLMPMGRPVDERG